MKKEKKKQEHDPMLNYDPTDRNFQRTDEDDSRKKETPPAAEEHNTKRGTVKQIRNNGRK